MNTNTHDKVTTCSYINFCCSFMRIILSGSDKEADRGKNSGFDACSDQMHSYGRQIMAKGRLDPRLLHDTRR